MARARNMQALTDNIEGEFPGVVIYGIGDRAHAATSSDHNEDDTPGVQAEQSDSDSDREHRAIDVMIGPKFSKQAADQLVALLLANPAALARLAYIIWNGHIWSRRSGWVRREYTGSNKHTDHVHISGLAADDENGAGWPAVKGANVPFSEEDRAVLRAATWQYNGGGIGENTSKNLDGKNRATLSYFDEILRTVRLIAGKVDIDPAELAAIQAAAQAGAAQALAEAQEGLVQAIVEGTLAGLDPADLTIENVEAASRRAVVSVLQGVG